MGGYGEKEKWEDNSLSLSLSLSRVDSFAERACYTWPPVIFIYVVFHYGVRVKVGKGGGGRMDCHPAAAAVASFLLASSGRYSVTTCRCLLATDTRGQSSQSTNTRKKETRDPSQEW